MLCCKEMRFSKTNTNLLLTMDKRAKLKLMDLIMNIISKDS